MTPSRELMSIQSGKADFKNESKKNEVRAASVFLFFLCLLIFDLSLPRLGMQA